MKPGFTTERYYPDHADAHGEAAVKRHLNRYKWAASRIPVGSYVVDAGCGSGYGDYILRGNASFILGVDASSEAIRYAKKRVVKSKIKGIHYDCQDLRWLDLGDVKFDVAVCIEVIEHVSKRDQDKMLSSLKYVLNDDGILLITTPERKRAGKMTPHHVHEMSRYEFENLLFRHFTKVEYDSPIRFGIPSDFMLAVCGGVKK